MQTNSSISLSDPAGAALHWLIKAFHATGRRGIAAYYRKLPLLPGGWSAAYPETTGYLIETLYRYAPAYPEAGLDNMARTCAEWICTLQHHDGALPGGLAGSTAPSVFNTGQMIFGLIRAYEVTGAELFLNSAEKAVRWLEHNLEPDGSWSTAAYVPGFIPSYYTRVVWAVLAANRILQSPALTASMEQALTFYFQRFLPNGAVRDWGFFPGQPAFTHTVAYTFRGALESAILLDRQDLIDRVEQSCARLARLIRENKRLAGRYTTDWQGDYSFQCLTGNAQLAIVFVRLWEVTGQSGYLDVARQIFRPVLQTQYRGSDPQRYGAIPGSRPVWGLYFRFRYPNWAAKFFLDAYDLLNESSGLIT